MKKQLIDWIVAQVIHRLKLPPRIFALIASLIGAGMYGVSYYEGMGHEVPNIVSRIASPEGLIGFILGTILQSHSTAYRKNGDDKNADLMSANNVKKPDSQAPYN